jgi:hypothetical protein
MSDLDFTNHVRLKNRQQYIKNRQKQEADNKWRKLKNEVLLGIVDIKEQ